MRLKEIMEQAAVMKRDLLPSLPAFSARPLTTGSRII